VFLIKLVSKIQMETKKLLVSFCLIASVLFLMSTIAAAEITDDYAVYINGNEVVEGDIIGVTEGETIALKVVFKSNVTGSNVKVEAEIDGYDVKETTAEFDVLEDTKYSKTLSLKIPYELGDELDEDATLEIKISNKDHETELFSPEGISLRVQRESHNVAIMSVSTTQSAEAGELFAVDVVLRNKGYNDLEDLYVTVLIPELGVERTAYFGDLVAEEIEEDDEDTVSGRIYLQIPDDAKAGTYTLKVEASNEDTITTKSKEIVVKGLETTVIKSADGLILVNPGNKVQVYRVVSDTTEKFVVVEAGSSKTVEITETGEYSVFLGDELVETVVVEGKGKEISSVVVLTVVLAIIFIVLLIVLFVLVGKKPEQEEFGESYY